MTLSPLWMRSWYQSIFNVTTARGTFNSCSTQFQYKESEKYNHREISLHKVDLVSDWALLLFHLISRRNTCFSPNLITLTLFFFRYSPLWWRLTKVETGFSDEKGENWRKSCLVKKSEKSQKIYIPETLETWDLMQVRVLPRLFGGNIRGEILSYIWFICHNWQLDKYFHISYRGLPISACFHPREIPASCTGPASAPTRTSCAHCDNTIVAVRNDTCQNKSGGSLSHMVSLFWHCKKVQEGNWNPYWLRIYQPLLHTVAWILFW